MPDSRSSTSVRDADQGCDNGSQKRADKQRDKRIDGLEPIGRWRDILSPPGDRTDTIHIVDAIEVFHRDKQYGGGVGAMDMNPPGQG